MAIKYSVSHFPEAEEFKNSLSEKERKKLDFVIGKVEAGLIEKEWFKKLSPSEIWEFRVDIGVNFIRLLCFMDGNDIITTHGFKKQSNKTPKKEIDKAEAIRQQYLE